MNGEAGAPTRIDKFNQLVRGLVVLALTAGLIYGFVVSKVVSTETFVVIATYVFTWWFKSRDEKDVVGKPSASAPLATPPPPAPTP